MIASWEKTVEEIEAVEEIELFPPHQATVDGIVPQRIDFIADQTFKTPRKHIKKKMDDWDVSETVLSCWNVCTGFPIQIYSSSSDHDNRGVCSFCGKKTSWYCIGCRAYFCLASSKRIQIDDLYYLPTFTKNGLRTDKDRFFHKSCYHKKHAEAYKKTVPLCRICNKWVKRTVGLCKPKPVSSELLIFIKHLIDL